MSQLRVEKVQELMKQEISEIILRELKPSNVPATSARQRST